MADGIGLSVGATALQAVAVGRAAVRRSPVLTRYPHRPSEVGVPSENPNLAERGLIVTDFVDRVGDPVPIIASDGSSHRAEVLLAEALQSLLSALTGGGPPSEPVGVTHPAHWNPAAIAALRGALATQPAFRGVPTFQLSSDAPASLTALQDDPGLPTRGIIALCDIGGSGASITIVDAANGNQPIGPTVRHGDLSGDLIDQALLARVVDDLGKMGAVDLSSTAAIGSLGRLRGQCRVAKEQLSTSAVTSIAVDLPQNRTDVRVTRIELDEAIRGAVTGFVDVLQDTLQRSGIHSNDLVAVASVGGVAHLPILTTMLSEQLRVPVISSRQPEFAAAIGGGLTAVRGLVPDSATAMAPAAVAVAPTAMAAGGPPQSSTFRALAWSDADDVPEPMPAAPSPVDYRADYAAFEPREAFEPGEAFEPRPAMAFTHPDEDPAAAQPTPWFRRPVALVAMVLTVAAAVLTGTVVYVLRNDESPASTSTPTSTSAAPVPAEQPPASEAPPVSEAPPASEAPQATDVPQAPQAPPVQQAPASQAPPPEVTVTQTVTQEPPPPPPSSEAPQPQQSQQPQPEQPAPPPPSSQQPVIPTLPYRTIPGLPFVPAPIQPP